MAKLVILKFDGGNFQDGFKVTLQIGDEGEQLSESPGNLPPNPFIPENYQRWQSDFLELDKRLLRGSWVSSRVISSPGILDQCQQSAKIFLKNFRDWLSSQDSTLRDLREKLCRKLGDEKKPIRVIIKTDEPLLKKLPWHQWDLLADTYTQAEVALCPIEYEKPSLVPTTNKTAVRILAILGNSEGIHVESDRKFLEKLKVKGAEPTFLVEPKHAEISDNLWEQNWDILFFAGHSSSENETGRIYINRSPNPKENSLTITQLKFGLRKAIQHGLQLAILNSCDGLKLAEDLADLNIPQVIVMRESVPDQVAQKFLQFFLEAFAGGESLYVAVRHARERLHENRLDDEFPGASWLPVIYQNPTIMPVNWENLCGKISVRNDKFPVPADSQYGTKPNIEQYSLIKPTPNGNFVAFSEHSDDYIKTAWEKNVDHGQSSSVVRIESQPELKYNPFSKYDEIVFGKDFFVGRENVIDIIKQRIIKAREPGCLAIVGSPKMGKSSLAHHTLIEPSKSLLEKKLLIFQVELSQIVSQQVLFNFLISKTLEKLDAGNALNETLFRQGKLLLTVDCAGLERQEKVRRFFKRIRRTGWRVVAIIDEFDTACDLFRENGAAFEALNGLASEVDSRICLVTLSQQSLTEILPQSSISAQFQRIFREEKLQCFTNKELADLLEKLNQIDFSLTDELLDFLWKKTSGHPYLAYTLAFHIADMWLNNKESDLEKALQNSMFAFNKVASTKMN